MLGLESIKDADGKIIQEAPLQLWANFRQRALDTAMAEINEKDGLKHFTRIAGAIKTPAGNDFDFCD